MISNAFKHSLHLALAAAAATVLLSGCHDKQEHGSPATESPAAASAPENPAAIALAQRSALIGDISGVWRPQESDGLLTLYVSGNDAQASQGDKALSVSLGDVDPANGTVILKVNAQGKEELRTLTRIKGEDGSAGGLQITGEDGHQEMYTFVRKVGNDDLNRIARLRASAVPSASAPAPAAAQAKPSATTNRGVIDMYLGGIDMNLRSCPGSTCAATLIVPKDSKVNADTSTIRYVTETSGVNTPWVRVTYEGAYCTPAEQDSQTGCAPSRGTEAPVTGWMNYTRLLDAPRPQQ